MRQKEPAISYETALEQYYGGIKGLQGQGIPFTCKCGGKTYPAISETSGELIAMPVVKIGDLIKHIRKVHHERVKRGAN